MFIIIGHLSFYAMFNVIQTLRNDCEFLLFAFMLAKVYRLLTKLWELSGKNIFPNSPSFKDKIVDTL